MESEAGASIPSKLEAAYTAFRALCKSIRETPMVKHFTKENLGWTSMGKYPECSFKGSDTRLILHFLIAFLERPEVSLDASASNGYVAAKAVHCVLRKIFSCKSALFKRCEAYEVLANLNLWSEKFRQCAQQCFDQQLCFFAFTPKYNFLLHVAADMHRQLDESSFQDKMLNPSLFDVTRVFRVCGDDSACCCAS